VVQQRRRGDAPAQVPLVPMVGERPSCGGELKIKEPNSFWGGVNMGSEGNVL